MRRFRFSIVAVLGIAFGVLQGYSTPVAAATVSYFINGTTELGSFSGRFSYDDAATDLDFDPQAGLFNLKQWEINFTGLPLTPGPFNQPIIRSGLGTGFGQIGLANSFPDRTQPTELKLLFGKDTLPGVSDGLFLTLRSVLPFGGDPNQLGILPTRLAEAVFDTGDLLLERSNGGASEVYAVTSLKIDVVPLPASLFFSLSALVALMLGRLRRPA